MMNMANSKLFNMDRWNGRVALVTGASSGIGAEICRHLVRYGMTVVGCARRLDKISSIADEREVKDSPGRLVAKKCDLRNESEILALFKDIKENLGRLDVCINNGGVSLNTELLKSDTEEWRNMLDVNVLAVCICTREAVKLMREKSIDGHIIQMSSMSGHRIREGADHIHFYSGTKHMVKALTECHRSELKSLNSKIRISMVSPGIVETQLVTNFYERRPEKQPSYKNILQANDIADIVVYILRSPSHMEMHDILVRSTAQLV